MRLLVTISAALVLIASVAAAQDNYYSPYTGYERELPVIGVNDRAATLQESLFPDYYTSRSALSDMRWVQRNDSAIVAFWKENRATILKTLSDLSGLAWQEKEFDIYLLRYYTSAGSSEPLILPIGGIRTGHLTQAAPEGSRLQLNLIFELSRRMLAQSVVPEANYYHPIADHPLMRPGTHRRDVLAMLLALVTCEQVIGIDSAYGAYRSAFWQQRFPGREVFEQYVLKEWILTPDRPLAQWIIEEPYGSSLVIASRPPRVSSASTGPRKIEYIEGLPLKGRLGFSVTFEGRNLIIDKIDVERAGFACGLREGDVIRSVDGQRVRSQKDLIEKILATFDQSGTTVQVVREGATVTLLLQPIDFAAEDETFYLDEQRLYDDSVYYQPPPIPEDSTDTTDTTGY